MNDFDKLNFKKKELKRNPFWIQRRQYLIINNNNNSLKMSKIDSFVDHSHQLEIPSRKSFLP